MALPGNQTHSSLSMRVFYMRGHYSYDQGYEPEFEGKASFSGEVHPVLPGESRSHR